MAERFNLTAQIQLQAPTNTAQVVGQIRKQLQGINVDVKVKANTPQVAKLNKELQGVSKASDASTKSIGRMNTTLAQAARRFSVITVATGSLLALARAFKNGTKEAVGFERELIKISQVTGKSVSQLQGLTKEVTRLSTSLGVSSSELLNVSRVLSQAGFNAIKTKQALETLAQTTLAATFDNIKDTTEGAIAVLRQFSAEARASGGEIKFLASTMDAINSVSKRFAVESGDLITAIRRVGGVFAAAGGSVNELIALFTSVRATTRESAETIATGLRTIFTRIQRTDTVDQLKELGIQLRNSQGQFVGAYEAVRRLSAGLSQLDPRDARFSDIVEELGGFRQVGKVIPLIQQFATAQAALTVAQNSSGSVARDAAKAQAGLGVEITKVREEFSALLRQFADSGSFRSLATGALQIASAFIKVASALEDVLPLLTILMGMKLGQLAAPGLGALIGGTRRKNQGGKIHGFARGGFVPGTGSRDTVPAMLSPGEFVIKKSSAKKLGASTLQAMNNNRYASGGAVELSKRSRTMQNLVYRGKRNISKQSGVDFDPSKNQFTEGDTFTGDIKNTKIRPQKSVVDRMLKADKAALLNSSNTIAQGNAFEKYLIESKRMTVPTGFGATHPLDGKKGSELLEVKRTSVADAVLLDKNVRHQIKTGNKLNRTRLSGQADNINLPSLTELELDKNAIAALKKTAGVKPQRRAKGGGISGSDTVPALLTPGEFVINKSSAQGIGYSNLNKMNQTGVKRFAAGGRVGGVQRFANGGEADFIPGSSSASESSPRSKELIRETEKLTRTFKKYGKNVARLNKPLVNVTSNFKKLASIFGELEVAAKNTAESLDGLEDEAESTSTALSEGGAGQAESRFQKGLQTVDRIAGAAQQFVFLGAAAAAVGAQFTSLESTTQEAISATATQFATIVGIGGTVAQMFTSLARTGIGVAIANKIEALASGTAAKADTVEAGASLGAAVALGPIAVIGATIAIALTGLVVAMEFFRQRAIATAKKLNQEVDDEFATLTETGKGSTESIAGKQFQIATGYTTPEAAAANARRNKDMEDFVDPMGSHTESDNFLEYFQKLEAVILKTAKGAVEAEKQLYQMNEAFADIDTGRYADNAEGRAKRITERQKVIDDNFQPAVNRQAAAGQGFKALLAEIRKNTGNTSISQLDLETGGGSFDALSDVYKKQAENLRRQLETSTTIIGESGKQIQQNLSAAIGETDGTKTFQQLLAEGGAVAKAFAASKENIRVQAAETRRLLKVQLQNAKLISDSNLRKAEEARLQGEINDLNKRENESQKRNEQGVKDVIDSTYNLRTAQIQTAEAAVALAKALREGAKFGASLSYLEEELERAGNRMNNSLSALDEGDIELKRDKVTGLDDPTNLAKRSQTRREMLNIKNLLPDDLKPQFSEAAQNVLTGDRFFKDRENIQREAADIEAETDPAIKKQAQSDFIKRLLAKAKVDPNNKKLSDELTKKLQESIQAGTLANDLDGIFSFVKDNAEQGAKLVEQANQLLQKDLDNYGSYLDGIQSLRDKEIGARSKLIDVQTKGAEIRAEARGDQVSIEARERARQAKAAAALQGTGAQAGNVASLAKALADATSTQSRLATADPTRKNIEASKKQADIIKRVNAELERLGDQSERTSDILGEIDKERQKRQAVTGIVEDFVVGGQQERFDINKSIAGINKALRTGTLQNQSPDQRAATVAMLERLGDNQLAGAGGLTAKQVKQELIFRDAVKLGLDPEIARQLATSTSAEERLISSLDKLTAVMEAAARAQSNQAGKNLLNAPGPPASLNSNGGLIYRADGGSIFQPKGTDTVPAMLTPGEFVIKKSSVDRIGVGNLQALNNGVQYRQRGGRITTEEEARKLHDQARAAGSNGRTLNETFGTSDPDELINLQKQRDAQRTHDNMPGGRNQRRRFEALGRNIEAPDRPGSRRKNKVLTEEQMAEMRRKAKARRLQREEDRNEGRTSNEDITPYGDLAMGTSAGAAVGSGVPDVPPTSATGGQSATGSDSLKSASEIADDINAKVRRAQQNRILTPDESRKSHEFARNNKNPNFNNDQWYKDNISVQGMSTEDIVARGYRMKAKELHDHMPGGRNQRHRFEILARNAQKPATKEGEKVINFGQWGEIDYGVVGPKKYDSQGNRVFDGSGEQLTIEQIKENAKRKTRERKLIRESGKNWREALKEEKIKQDKIKNKSRSRSRRRKLPPTPPSSSGDTDTKKRQSFLLDGINRLMNETNEQRRRAEEKRQIPDIQNVPFDRRDYPNLPENRAELPGGGSQFLASMQDDLSIDPRTGKPFTTQELAAENVRASGERASQQHEQARTSKNLNYKPTNKNEHWFLDHVSVGGSSTEDIVGLGHWLNERRRGDNMPGGRNMRHRFDILARNAQKPETKPGEKVINFGEYGEIDYGVVGPKKYDAQGRRVFGGGGDTLTTDQIKAKAKRKTEERTRIRAADKKKREAREKAKQDRDLSTNEDISSGPVLPPDPTAAYEADPPPSDSNNRRRRGRPRRRRGEAPETQIPTTGPRYKQLIAQLRRAHKIAKSQGDNFDRGELQKVLAGEYNFEKSRAVVHSAAVSVHKLKNSTEMAHQLADQIFNKEESFSRKGLMGAGLPRGDAADLRKRVKYIEKFHRPRLNTLNDVFEFVRKRTHHPADEFDGRRAQHAAGKDIFMNAAKMLRLKPGVGLRSLQAAIKKQGGRNAFYMGLPAEGFAQGGGVAGSDTVPAMLTPGEFVMSREAVQSHGVGYMKQLNKGHIPGFRHGGVVGTGGMQYKQGGGQIGGGGGMAIDPSALAEVLSNFNVNFVAGLDNVVAQFAGFSQSFTNLAATFSNLTMQHSFSGDMTLAFNITNADAIKNAVADAVTPKITEIITNELNTRLNKDFQAGP